MTSIMFGFRNATQELRLADWTSATITSTPSAIGVRDGGNDQSVEEHQGCCYEQ